MLDAGSAQGLPLNTGWLKDGVWPFFAGFFGLAHRSQGNVSRAWDVLYAYANHANPLGTWVEEQLSKSVGAKTAGDGSNASASALYIVLLKGLLAFERGNTLELLAGLPEHWLFPRSELHLNSVRTGCGEVTLSMQMSPDGRTGSITVEPIRGNDSKGGPVLFLQFLKKAGFVDERGSELRDRLYGSWGRKTTVNFRRND